MRLKELHINFIDDASKLGDYNLLTKTELANGYCDADEASARAKAENNIEEMVKQERLRSEYFSALMLRYWYKIYEWQSNSASLMLEKEEFVAWLSKSLYVAFYYRNWRYEYEAIVQHGKFIDWKYDANGERIPNKYYYITDPNAPDKIINRCCASMRGRVYQYHNKDKRKASVQTYSLDQMIDDNGDSALDFANCTSDDKPQSLNSIHILVNEFIKKNQTVEALIIDGIANYDSYKTKKHKETYLAENDKGEFVQKKKTSITSSFDARKVVKHLNLVDDKFVNNFCRIYSIDLSRSKPIYDDLKKLTNAKLYKYINKTLTQISQNSRLLECLAN